MQLNTVVLPAPFGPISAGMSRLPASKETSSTAGRGAGRPPPSAREGGGGGADDPARAPDHDPDHGDAEQEHAVERGIESLAENALQAFGMAKRLEAPDHDDRRDRHAKLASHAAQNHDGEDDGGFDEGETFGGGGG